MRELATIKRGQTFTFAGSKWIVLETHGGATLVLMANYLKKRPFDKDDSADWRQSDARKYLNFVYRNDLEQLAGDQRDKILCIDVDLTAGDGTFRERCTDRVALLTVEQYRRNRDILEPLPTHWWTLTRTSIHSPNGMIVVMADGTLRYHGLAYYGRTGLRPVLLLSSDLMIGDEGNPDQTAETPQQEPPGQPVEDPGTDGTGQAVPADGHQPADL